MLMKSTLIASTALIALVMCFSSCSSRYKQNQDFNTLIEISCRSNVNHSEAECEDYKKIAKSNLYTVEEFRNKIRRDMTHTLDEAILKLQVADNINDAAIRALDSKRDAMKINNLQGTYGSGLGEVLYLRVTAAWGDISALNAWKPGMTPEQAANAVGPWNQTPLNDYRSNLLKQLKRP